MVTRRQGARRQGATISDEREPLMVEQAAGTRGATPTLRFC
ncbi:hypothetical protein [Actinoplanes sp. M2I2]|nr:hypothetical protein [Actinoplanes sp. M2I2]